MKNFLIKMELTVYQDISMMAELSPRTHTSTHTTQPVFDVAAAPLQPIHGNNVKIVTL